ncbi:MAG: helix-turn-helix transcriptional regulator, partial [Verrucomicrobia bacterium]|nr:helix-turn-helix transcriptional regulator [Verrucomicrobiota bacterium]
RILDELAGGERCVCELVAAVGSSWSTVSRHLSVLKTAGVIADDKRGLQVFYRLALVQPWHRQARRLGALGRRGEETPGLNVGTPLPPFFR